jgi:hypothetical protein
VRKPKRNALPANREGVLKVLTSYQLAMRGSTGLRMDFGHWVVGIRRPLLADYGPILVA